MALHIPLGRAARVCLSAARPRASSLAEGGGTCGARDVPACPPCRGAPQPACRARPATVRRAQRVVCCAPPQGSRPPCAPLEPACSLTCRDLLDQNRELLKQAHSEVSSHNASSGCDCEQDPVAQRIQLAKRARREQYEREVASIARRVRPPARAPAAPYRLGGERECARATDGCLYAVRCGPGRTPPPPRCVELAPDDGCRIKGDANLDPCAHRPRVMIEIDRSANAMTSEPDRPAPPTPSSSSAGGTERTGDAGWCASPPAPAPAPQRCRRPTIVERLRARSAPHLPNSQNKRQLHTSVMFFKSGKKISTVSGGLDGMLRSKQQLKEAGVGRVVVDAGASRTGHAHAPGGRLEMCVPSGTARVAVLVSLEGAAPAQCGGAAPADRAPPAVSCVKSVASTDTTVLSQKSSSPCNHFTSTNEKRDPWLTIRKFHKKLTGCNDKDPSGPAVGSAGPESRAGGHCTPARCQQSPNKPTQGKNRKHCSTSALLANTIEVNS